MTRKNIIFILFAQEIGLLVISALWLFFRNANSFSIHGISALYDLNLFKGWAVNFQSLVYSIAAGLVLLLLSLIIIFTYEPFRKSLEAIDNLILNKIKMVDAFPIAVLSGLGEEIFFRGILQEETGILWSSVIFALLHIPGTTYWVYSLWALFASLYLGNIYALTNNLFIVIVAHVLNNFIALILWSRYKNKILKN